MNPQTKNLIQVHQEVTAVFSSIPLRVNVRRRAECKTDFFRTAQRVAAAAGIINYSGGEYFVITAGGLRCRISNGPLAY